MKEDPTKQVDALNINSMLTSQEKILRTMLLDKLIEEKRPISPADTVFEGKESITKSLSDKGLIVVNGDGELSGLYPVSAILTRHKVQLGDGRSLYAMCAIDSLGIAYEFQQDVIISSSCSKCNTPILLEIIDDKIFSSNPSTTHALHVALGEYKDWANTC